MAKHDICCSKFPFSFNFKISQGQKLSKEGCKWFWRQQTPSCAKSSLILLGKSRRALKCSRHNSSNNWVAFSDVHAILPAYFNGLPICEPQRGKTSAWLNTVKTLADSISLHCYRYTDWQQDCPSMQKIKTPATSPTLFQDVSKAMRPSENWLWYSAEVSCKSTCCHFLAKSSHGIGGHMTPIQDMAVHFLWGINTTHAINEALQRWTKRSHQDTCTGVKWKIRFYHLKYIVMLSCCASMASVFGSTKDGGAVGKEMQWK